MFFTRFSRHLLAEEAVANGEVDITEEVAVVVLAGAVAVLAGAVAVLAGAVVSEEAAHQAAGEHGLIVPLLMANPKGFLTRVHSNVPTCYTYHIMKYGG